MSARFRPRTLTGLASFAPAPLHFTSISQTPFPFHCVPTAANWRDSQEQVGARPKIAAGRATANSATSNSPRCFARPRHSNMAARLRLSPKTSNSAARLRPAKTSAITVSTAIFRPLHFAGAPFRRSERWPTSLTNPNWSDTPPLGCMAVCRDFPFAHFIAQPAVSLHQRRVRIVGFALARLRRETNPANAAHRLRGGLA